MPLLCRGRLHVRRERVDAIGLDAPVRLLYASDLHLGRPWNRGVAIELEAIARDSAADAVLLGGDLADNAVGIPALGELTRALADQRPVFAVPGNHDHRLGVDRVREAVEAGGGTWLTIASVGPLQLEAHPHSPSHAHPRRVLVSHDPEVFDDAVAAGFRVVLAGHLHGGQCVLLTRGRNLLYPGAFFARYTGLCFARNGTTMLVSRGAADTLPLRFNCPREVVLCTIS